MSAAEQPAMRIEAPDATYKSLLALLSSPAASAVDHLALIGSTSLSASITHYLATLPTDEAATFAQTLVTSKAVWSTLETASMTKRQNNNDQQATLHDQSTSNSLLSRAQLVFEATARAVLGRIQVVAYQHKGSVGWNAQRTFVAWIRALSDAVHVDLDSIPTACNAVPISTLALQTGIVAGLQSARAKRKADEAAAAKTTLTSSNTNSNSLSTRYALRRAEEEWCTTLTEALSVLDERLASKGQDQKIDSDDNAWEREFRKAALTITGGTATEELRQQPKIHGPQNDVYTVTLFLAAQISPYVKASRLSVIPPDILVNVLSNTILVLFEQCNVVQSIREDVAQDAVGKLVLHATSPTRQRAAVLVAHPLFSVLGPLSRLMSLAFSGITRSLSPQQVQDVLLTHDAPLMRMFDIARQWQARWLGSRLAGAKDDEIADASKPSTKLLWTVFKTILFSYTMIFDALMEAIVDVCPTPTETRPILTAEPSDDQTRWQATTESNFPPAYLDIVQLILRTYSHLSWITATFGSSAFDAYRRVFYEALEVLARDGRASVALSRTLMPASLTTFEANAARRAEAVFFLDTAEQLMVQLPDDMVEEVILPACRPYLDDRTYQEAFESAHSAVLSIYANDKECALELTPYYTRLLLLSFPKHLSVEQLTLAFSTVIDAVSDRSDTMAWYTLERLWQEIEVENLRIATNDQSTERQPTSLASVQHAAQDGSQEKSNAEDELEGMTQRQRDLSDVYVAQVQNVNLVLLRSMLQRIKRLIMQRPRAGKSRLHLCEKTFASLSGLDASTREEGVRWWLEEREAFGV